MDKKSVKHSFFAEKREKISVSGVLSVKNYDENVIILETDAGGMEISGNGLHIESLMIESGELVVSGRLDGVCYTALRDGGFWKKLFA